MTDSGRGHRPACGSLRRYALQSDRQRAHRRARDGRPASRGSCGAATSCCSAAGSSPEWTELPLAAGFMPFMDLLLNRLARGEVALARGRAGRRRCRCPTCATGVRQGEREWRVEGGGSFRPADVGAYYLLAGADTLGAISANLDPRESLLAPAARTTRSGSSGTGARVVPLERGRRRWRSAAGAMADLRGPLLLAALAARRSPSSVWRACGGGSGEAPAGARRVRRARRRRRISPTRLPARGETLPPRRTAPARAASVLAAWLAHALPAAAGRGRRHHAGARRSAGSPTSPCSPTSPSRSIPSARRWARRSRTTRSPASGPRRSRRCCAGRLRMLVTTARATAERTLVPAALERLRLRARAGRAASARATWPRALEAMGYRRVATVTEVAEFSVRGGILDVYGFGMAAPARLEWWGDDISSHPRRSTSPPSARCEELEEVTVLPVSTAVALEPSGDDVGRRPRRRARRCSSCCPPTPCSSRRRPAPTRTRWSARGARRSTTSRSPGGWARTCPAATRSSRSPTAWRERLARVPAAHAARRQPPISSSASSRRSRSTATSTGCARCSPDRRPRSSSATTRASSSGSTSCSTRAAAGDAGRTLAIGALDGGFVMPLAPGAHRPRDLPPRAPAAARPALPPGGAVARHRRAHRAATTWCTSSTASGSIAGSRRSWWASPRSRWRSWSTRAATGSTCRSTGSTSSSATAPRARTATGRRRGSTGSAARRGSGSGSRPARRSSRWPPSCSTSTPGARVAAGYAFPPDTQWQRELESSFLYEDTPDQRKATDEVKTRHGAAAARWIGCWSATSATARPRSRCAPRSRRCRAASRSRCWCRRRFSRSSTAARSASGWPTSRSRSRCSPASGPRRSRRRRSRGWPTGQTDIVIGTHRLLSKDVDVQGPRPPGRGRGASLRRQAQGAAQGAPARGGRAHAHRDADSAHAASLARRAARPHADRDRRRATARRSSPSSSRGTTGCSRRRSRGSSIAAGRSSSSTTGSRPSRPIAARVRALAPRARVGRGARTDAGGGAGDGHARVRGRRGGRPRLHHDRRVGARRAEREHDGRPRRRPLRPGPALPAPRPGGPEPPPGVLLPAGARRHRRRRRGAAPGAGAPHRARRRLPDRAQGPGAPRRGQPARRGAVGPRPRGRLRPVPAVAGGDGAGLRGQGGDGAARAARRGARPSGAPAGRLRPRRRRQARPVPPTGAGARTRRN